MPRSSVNWASRQRQRFIEDKLILTGHINRTMLSDYFGVEKSTGSMDIAAYIAAGGPIRRALRHETPVPLKEAVERGIGAGRPIGSKGYYVWDGSGEFITGSTPERREAWGLLPCGYASHTTWLNAVMSAWTADKRGTEDEMAEYFGVTPLMAGKIMAADLGAEYNSARAVIWPLFK